MARPTVLVEPIRLQTLDGRAPAGAVRPRAVDEDDVRPISHAVLLSEGEEPGHHLATVGTMSHGARIGSRRKAREGE